MIGIDRRNELEKNRRIIVFCLVTPVLPVTWSLSLGLKITCHFTVDCWFPRDCFLGLGPDFLC